jgi:GT2 family glycosyltransferase
MLGACLLARREAIKGSRLLDEGFPLYCEDIDFCRRLKKGGWTISYIPRATVVHHHLAKSDSRLFCWESLLHARSMLHFARKHYGMGYSRGDLYPGINVLQP